MASWRTKWKEWTALGTSSDRSGIPADELGVAADSDGLGIGAADLGGGAASVPARGAAFVIDEGVAGGGAPAVRAANELIREALVRRASDIHLEDHPEGMRLRYRVDGLLREVTPPDQKLRAAVLARLRVMGGLNLAEHRVPQDGRTRVSFQGRNIDLRISTVPMLNGESVVLRVLDPTRESIGLEDLGIQPEDLEALMDVISRPHGMILTTGPGGAGKSTTLHAILQQISTGEEKILTVEDPVEYDAEGICQVSVNERAGLTFPTILRSLVRQDPDVLLVGEIRDGETADIATQAALTGHLVLSTLHTTDSISALPRLLDLGVPDYLVSHTLEAVMAQRLVRQVCPDCGEDVEFGEGELGALGPGSHEVTDGKLGAGCDSCAGTGYLGRTGLYQFLRITDDLREGFLRRRSVRELRKIATDGGTRTLREDGLAKIQAGVTTPDEVLRVT